MIEEKKYTESDFLVYFHSPLKMLEDVRYDKCKSVVDKEKKFIKLAETLSTSVNSLETDQRLDYKEKFQIYSCLDTMTSFSRLGYMADQLKNKWVKSTNFYDFEWMTQILHHAINVLKLLIKGYPDFNQSYLYRYWIHCILYLERHRSRFLLSIIDYKELKESEVKLYFSHIRSQTADAIAESFINYQNLLRTYSSNPKVTQESKSLQRIIDIYLENKGKNVETDKQFLELSHGRNTRIEPHDIQTYLKDPIQLAKFYFQFPDQKSIDKLQEMFKSEKLSEIFASIPAEEKNHQHNLEKLKSFSCSLTNAFDVNEEDHYFTHSVKLPSPESIIRTNSGVINMMSSYEIVAHQQFYYDFLTLKNFDLLDRIFQRLFINLTDLKSQYLQEIFNPFFTIFGSGAMLNQPLAFIQAQKSKLEDLFDNSRPREIEIIIKNLTVISAFYQACRGGYCMQAHQIQRKIDNNEFIPLLKDQLSALRTFSEIKDYKPLKNSKLEKYKNLHVNNLRLLILTILKNETVLTSVDKFEQALRVLKDFPEIFQAEMHLLLKYIEVKTQKPATDFSKLNSLQKNQQRLREVLAVLSPSHTIKSDIIPSNLYSAFTLPKDILLESTPLIPVLVDLVRSYLLPIDYPHVSSLNPSLPDTVELSWQDWLSTQDEKSLAGYDTVDYCFQALFANRPDLIPRLLSGNGDWDRTREVELVYDRQISHWCCKTWQDKFLTYIEPDTKTFKFTLLQCFLMELMRLMVYKSQYICIVSANELKFYTQVVLLLLEKGVKLHLETINPKSPLNIIWKLGNFKLLSKAMELSSYWLEVEKGPTVHADPLALAFPETEKPLSTIFLSARTTYCWDNFKYLLEKEPYRDFFNLADNKSSITYDKANLYRLTEAYRNDDDYHEDSQQLLKIILLWIDQNPQLVSEYLDKLIIKLMKTKFNSVYLITELLEKWYSMDSKQVKAGFLYSVDSTLCDWCKRYLPNLGFKSADFYQSKVLSTSSNPFKIVARNQNPDSSVITQSSSKRKFMG